MRINGTPEELRNWRLAKMRIAKELGQYYRACTTGELPPELLMLSMKLDQELLKKQRK